MTEPVAGPVLIVGSGLLGASVGLALRRAGVTTYLEDADPEALRVAAERGAGEPGAVGDPRIVVVAVPPDAAGAVMAEASRRFAAATVTDVTSVKAQPLAAALALGADEGRVVGGHPLAGREVSGPAGARPDLFDDRVWVVAPVPGSDDERTRDIVALAKTCGAVPVVMSPSDHDRAVAVTSHAPQVLSSLLAARLLEVDDEAVAVSGQGLRDMTRIADSDPALWRAILAANSERVADVLSALADDLQAVVTDLRERGTGGPGTSATLDALERGVSGRQRIPGKHGTGATEFAVVSVMVADEPGQVASVLVAMGELGVNLEDIRIEHVLGRPSGLIDISVRPGAVGVLEAGLRERGFDVRS
ncbi:MAG: prephenate dehydrogenase [bacterium]